MKATDGPTGPPIPQVLVHSPQDNVGVVVAERLERGAAASGMVMGTNATFTIVLRDDIPFGHKIALAAMRSGTAVVKYGRSVGRITKDVRDGERVHTHNLATGQP